ncbi:MAG: hypothetical protein Kow00109_27080 [Acidobacteriota bacterium]
MRRFRMAIPLVVSGLLALSQLALAQAPASSCISCHGNEEFFGAEGPQLIAAFTQDVHAQAGLSCHDCHGGNPDPELGEDLGAMDPDFRPNPYRGVPARTEIPRFCGSCHSDASYMKRFDPDIRVDQEAEYRTSRHGLRLAEGDENVATCVDCHGVHGIRAATDPAAPVFPTNVAGTCGRCHSDPARMSTYRKQGEPFPTDQLERWRQSVHATALLERGDLSAPTCNDCHGNHGATPPGVESVTFVCGQCHAREARIFRESPKHQGFSQHNELLAGLEEVDCHACHEMPAGFAELAPVREFTECTICHGNHGVLRPTIAMLDPTPESPCGYCHSPQLEAPLRRSSWSLLGRTRNPEEVEQLLFEEAAARGLGGYRRFDWLVDRISSLPEHLASGEGAGAALKPAVAELLARLRIGRVGGPGAETQRRGTCADCHGVDREASVGAASAFTLSSRFRELSRAIAAAQQLLLAARRGGVETRPTLEKLQSAYQAAVELEVLLHTFDASEGGEFTTKQAEGLELARAALTAGEDALAELRNRRRGLFVSLIFIGITLLGLYLKIRELG